MLIVSDIPILVNKDTGFLGNIADTGQNDGLCTKRGKLGQKLFDSYIIEDDFESEFSVSTKPEDTLFSLSNKDNVIYLNTFSKTFSKTISPSLRIGYMVLPKKLVEPFDNRLGFYSCTVPTFEQYVIARLLQNGDFERHINKVRRNKRKELFDSSK